ncbi:MAG: hypothetical protein HC875_39440 [Anaerolineales bacterium]|nr:hypothetical protein [Anaerolineales bacterium]
MEQPQKVEEVRHILGLVSNPKVENEELMLFARKFYWDKVVGCWKKLEDGTVEVTLRLENEDQFEYLRDKRLRSFVAWE